MNIDHGKDFPTALVFGQLSSGDRFLSLVLKGTFRIVRGARARAPAAAEQLPIFTQDFPLDGEKPGGLLLFEADLVPFKPRADIVVLGSAYAPRGRPVRTMDVSIRVGQKQKTLRVFGERWWSFAGAQHPPLIAGPAEFTEMPLTYDRAFGGVDKHAALRPEDPRFRPWCAENIEGRGFIGSYTRDSIDRKPLPNLEDPAFLISSWNDSPRPAGCGFFPRTNEPRKSYFGSYEQRWQAEGKPSVPSDFRFEAFNGADPDLQIAGYLRGNEAASLAGVMPDGGDLGFVLPCLLPVATARRNSAAGPTFEAFRMALDTLVVMPEQSLFYVVWRGHVPILEEDASDIAAFGIEYQPIKLDPLADPDGRSGWR